jgi:acyl-CoA synthetase (AMP-forming)/AMP-acid ligase II
MNLYSVFFAYFVCRYTSGSTGDPKGAVVSDALWLRMLKDGLDSKQDPHVNISKGTHPPPPLLL